MSMDQMMMSTVQRPVKEAGILKAVKKVFSGSTLAIFFFLLLLRDTLVLHTKIGLLILVGIVLLAVSLLKPKVLYFILISLFSIEGFAVMENVSYPKIVAVLLIGGLTLRLALTRE